MRVVGCTFCSLGRSSDRHREDASSLSGVTAVYRGEDNPFSPAFAKLEAEEDEFVETTAECRSSKGTIER